MSWSRALNGAGRRTTHGEAKAIIDYAQGLQNRIRKGDTACELPCIAYYGTGRLWMQKRRRHSDTGKVTAKQFKRQRGYLDCLDVASNEKQMMQWFEEMTYIQLQQGALVPELEAVKSAMSQCFMSSDTSIKSAQFMYNVKSGEMEILVSRIHGENEKLPVKVLSDGEKGVISLVADIAYRMALLNPQKLQDVLKTSGIILIDEVDMHLHPSWQKKVMSDLTSIFPNVQFVVTTHAPGILANVEANHIRILNHSEIYRPSKTYGRDVEAILREVMDVDIRPARVIDLLKSFDDNIDNARYDLAEQILQQLRDILGDDDTSVVRNQVTLDVERLGEDGYDTYQKE